VRAGRSASGSPAAERRLRRVVRRLDGCLDAVPARMREVLVLRSGLGPAVRHSRAGVAALLDLSVRVVTRIEHRGVRRLEALDRRTGCSGSAAPRVTTILAAAGLPVSVAPSFPSATVTSAHATAPTSTSDQAHADAAGPKASSAGPSTPDSGGVLGESENRTPPAAAAPLARPGDGDFTFAVMVLALLVAVASGAVAVRREVR
jgi:hypothetical protein